MIIAVFETNELSNYYGDEEMNWVNGDDVVVPRT